MRAWLFASVPLALALACGGSDAADPSPGGADSGSGGQATSGGTPSGSSGASSGAPVLPPPAAASVLVPLELGHPSLDAAPFDQPRTLRVPPGFGIRVWARVDNARFLLQLPDGSVLVSHPKNGSIDRIVAATATAPPVVATFVSGLDRPHDMSLVGIGGAQWIYVGEAGRIVRFAYSSGATSAANPEILVDNLPDESNSELGSAYGHPLKNLAIRGDKMYVAIASQSNADARERDLAQVSIMRAAVHEYPLEGGAGRLYGKGLRNAEGLAISPEGDLWVAVNNRDNTPYPYDDGRYVRGAVVPEFVDDYPPEPFAKVTDGSDHGWPFCNPNPFTPSGRTNMPYDNDYDNNPDGAAFDCAALAPMAKGFEAHAAPLGFSFWSNGPGSYRNGAVAGLHGCWNCTKPRGYSVAMFPWTAAGPGDEIVLVDGFLADPLSTQSRWGRPVDAIPYGTDSLLISDDFSNSIYELYVK